MEEDFQLAVQLQEIYNQEEAGHAWNPSTDYDYNSKCWRSELPATDTLSRPGDMSVVDPSWELLDPSPDIHALFLQFNDMFFWGKLTGVEVKWSPRMTLCAGVCCYEGRGGLCSIRLSKPLLTLRPRKDLVETLLHEMIHALLFVTHNNKDRDSHGPEFCKHMNRINSATGAKISIYHSFHDEVDEYRKHWWLCNGPCQKRRPYFGYVKRAMNRAPSPLDPWWAEHQRTCGGTFIKVKEPENTSLKGKKKLEASQSRPGKLPEVKGINKDETEMVGVNILDNQKNKHNDSKEKSNGVDIRKFMPFSGTGYKLGERISTAVKFQSANSSSSEAVKSNASTNTILSYSTFSSDITDQKKALTSKIPKVSVANTKVFINVSGSPVRLNNNPISNPKLSVPKCGNSSTQRTLSFEMPTSSRSAPPPLQASSTQNPLFRPPKRPRLDDKNIKDFFSKTERNIIVGDMVTVVNNEHSSLHKKVNCPVCQVEVSEDKINDHLDNCLAI